MHGVKCMTAEDNLQEQQGSQTFKKLVQNGLSVSSLSKLPLNGLFTKQLETLDEHRRKLQTRADRAPASAAPDSSRR